MPCVRFCYIRVMLSKGKLADLVVAAVGQGLGDLGHAFRAPLTPLRARRQVIRREGLQARLFQGDPGLLARRRRDEDPVAVEAGTPGCGVRLQPPVSTVQPMLSTQSQNRM